jgi:uncharacterized cupredoxin-like copper-binding protein
MTMTRRTAASAVMLACVVPGVQAAGSGHGDHGGGQHAHKPANAQTAWGRSGKKNAATRTIEISMTDDMRFTPARLEIRQGETVRFRVRNAGKLEHELVLGTKPALDRHAARMQKEQAMDHHDASGVEVKPGRSGDLVWNFNRAGEFYYACLIPGHYQAGMVGTLTVVPAGKDAKR